MIGKACYVEVAMRAGGIWNPAKLEEEIDGNIDLEPSGRFRRMQNGVLPSDKSAERIQKKVYRGKRKCQILKWRDHPFWKLLSLQPLTYHDTEIALLSVNHGRIKRKIWLELPTQPYSLDMRYPRLKPDKEYIEKIAAFKNFDALIALVALAREGHGTGMIQTYTMAAHHCLEIFPDVMIKQPHLYICWKSLARRLIKLIWKPQVTFVIEMQQEITLPQLGKRINALDELAREQGAPLPPKEIIARYN